MSMSNWVCFKCRLSARHPTQFKGVVLCTQCRAVCTPLGYKIPVPPKGKVREWDILYEQLQQSAINTSNIQKLQMVRCKHDLEQEIVKLETKPLNEGRTKAIKLLRKRLEKLDS